MARRRRRGGGRRRGRGGNFSSYISFILVAALSIGVLTAISKRCELFDVGCPTQYVQRSEHDLFILDPTAHENAQESTTLKIYDRLSEPFGTYVNSEGKLVPENGISVPAEVTVIIISGTTNINQKVEIVTSSDINLVWSKVVGRANVGRAHDIYNAFLSPQSEIWRTVTELYFSETSNKPGVSECIDDLTAKSANLEISGGTYKQALGSLNAEASGGAQGAWTALCTFGSHTRSELDRVNTQLDSSALLCEDSSAKQEDKCSDIPGAISLLSSIIAEKEKWMSEGNSERGLREAVVCAYFGSDMMTNSYQYPEDSQLDIKGMIHQKKYPRDSFEADALARSARLQLMKDDFSNSTVRISVYSPMIGNIKNSNSRVLDASARNFLNEYWTSFFDDAYGSKLRLSSTGCEGNEFQGESR